MNRLTDTLTVAALPLDIVWADKAANLSAVEAAMERLPYGTDVLVLPELFTTAYTDDPDLMRELAERNTGDTIERIRTLAARHGVAIAGSFAAWTPPHIYNRAFFIEPSGEETFYDKRHLFSLSSEAGVLVAFCVPATPVVAPSKYIKIIKRAIGHFADDDPEDLRARTILGREQLNWLKEVESASEECE